MYRKKTKIQKLLDNVRYKILLFGFKTFAKLFSDYYIDQYETYRIKGKYTVYVRFDRSIPSSQIKYVIDV